MAERKQHQQVSKRTIPLLTEQVYQCISDYMDENGYSPSLDEIAERVHLSRSGVVRHLDRLEEQGRISREFRKRRTIVLIGEKEG